jgi:hypothetical protein
MITPEALDLGQGPETFWGDTVAEHRLPRCEEKASADGDDGDRSEEGDEQGSTIHKRVLRVDV